MAFTVLTKKYAEAVFRLPLTADGTAYLVCKPVFATKLSEISRQVMAENGFDAHISAARLPTALLEAYVVGWVGLQDMNGVEVPFSVDMLKEVCEADPDFAAQALERLRRIAREAHLEEEKKLKEWAGWQFGDRPTCEQCRWLHRGKQKCAECSRHASLSYLSEQAVEIWAMLRKHGAGVDSMAGVWLPIRYEAMREECNRYPATDELFWRVLLIDGEFVELQEQKRKQKESRKGNR